MILKTKLLGQVYDFPDIRTVMAKANEQKSGDVLAGLAFGGFAAALGLALPVF